MTTFLYVLHFLVCFVLIVVVLLQRGKGSDMGAALGGGGSNTVFGARGAGNFLSKATINLSLQVRAAWRRLHGLESRFVQETVQLRRRGPDR